MGLISLRFKAAELLFMKSQSSFNALFDLRIFLHKPHGVLQASYVLGGGALCGMELPHKTADSLRLKEYWHRNSPAVPAEANRNRKTNGSSPETSTSAGCHSARDSLCQEQAVVLDSRSIKISRLNNTIKSLEQQKKQVEHQLEEEKKANNEKQKAERELEVQIQRLNVQKKKLTIDLYHTKRSLIIFEEESKDLAARLQRSSQRTGELERALSAVTATQKKKADKVSLTTCPISWEPGFADGGVSLRVPSAGWSVLPRRRHGHVSLLLCLVVRGSLGLSQLLWVSWGVRWGASTGHRAWRPSACPALTWLGSWPSPRWGIGYLYCEGTEEYL
nr:uncharacterized protein LOC103231510 [Chlorocebus sabaeus]